MGRYEGFLLLIGSVFAPLFGVLLTDHFIVRRRQAGIAGALNLPGLAAWVVGIAAYQALSRLAPNVGATLPAFAVAAVVYLGFQAAKARLSPAKAAS